VYKKLVGAIAFIAALTVASAANTYRVDLYQATVVNGTTFKAGECKLEVKDNQVVLKQGKNVAESAVKVENASDKFNSTSVGYTNGNHIQEIRIGGTNTKLLFEDGPSSSAASGR
jgi:hypothetical protein